MYLLYISLIIVIIIIGVLILRIIVNNNLFYPVRHNYNYPNEIIIPEELYAIFIDKGPNTPIIIHSQGNAGNISDQLFLINYLKDIPVSLLLYEYRGFGKSPGTPSIENIIEDGESVYNYVKDKYPNRKIILCGRSMGSAVSFHLANKFKYDISGLIIISGYSSLSNVINDVTYSGIGSLLSYIMLLPDNMNNAQHLRCPVLFLHSDDDQLINISHAEKLATVIPTRVTLLKGKGGHNFCFENFIPDIASFISSL